MDKTQAYQLLKVAPEKWKDAKSQLFSDVWKGIVRAYTRYVLEECGYDLRKSIMSVIPDELLLEMIQNTTSKYLAEQHLLSFLPHKQNIIRQIDKNIFLILLYSDNNISSFLNQLNEEDEKFVETIILDNLKFAFSYREYNKNILIYALKHLKLDTIENKTKFEEALFLFGKHALQCGMYGLDDLFDIIPAEHKTLDSIVISNIDKLPKYIKKLNVTQLINAFDVVCKRSSAIDRSIFVTHPKCPTKILRVALTCLARIQRISDYNGNGEINAPITNEVLLQLNDSDRLNFCRKIFIPESGKQIFDKVTFDKSFRFDEIEAMLLPSAIKNSFSLKQVTEILKHVDRYKSQIEIGQSYLLRLVNILVKEEVNSIFKLSPEDSQKMLKTYAIIMERIKEFPKTEFDYFNSELSLFIVSCLKHTNRTQELDVIEWNEGRCRTLVQKIIELNIKN